MDLAERLRQFEPVCITGDNPVDGIGAKPFVVEFFCWVSCSDVLRAKPHCNDYNGFWDLTWLLSGGGSKDSIIQATVL